MTTAGTGMDREALRQRVLLATLPNVTFDGWTLQALQAGAASAGVEASGLPLLFPGGVSEVIERFSAWADAEMLRHLTQHDLSALRLRERVALAVRVRLESLLPHREAVRLGAAFLALPQNAGLGLKLTHRTVDAIWHAVGDRSADFSYYTKRLLLGGVATATLLYWLGDRSEGHADSWTFLERRIEDLMRMGEAMRRPGGLASLFSRLPSPSRFARHLRRPAE
jgi:ubiquinone biosynthesis protein COQ9